MVDDIKKEVKTRSAFDQQLFHLLFNLPIGKGVHSKRENMSQRKVARESGVSLSTVNKDFVRLRKDLYKEFIEDARDYFNGDYDKI